MDKQQNLDFYQTLRRKIKDWETKEGANHKWAEYILLAPDFFHLLCKLAIDKEVQTEGERNHSSPPRTQYFAGN